MNEDRFWSLVSLKLSGEARPDELAELEILLKENPSLGLRTEMLTSIWNSSNGTSANGLEESFNKHLQRLSNHLSEPVLQYETAEAELEMDESEEQPPKRSVYRRILIATSIAASFTLIFLFIWTRKAADPNPKANAHNTVSTKKGSKSKIHLPDGTQVWLNADSKITYNENFQGSIREVELSGEAFFDVVRDETRPFIIHTEAVDVKVLGTSFNVRSYADEKNTETSLIKGSVEITLRNSPDKKKIVLKPNDKLIVNNSLGTLVEKTGTAKVVTNVPVMTLAKINYQEKDSTATEIVWIKNKLAFDGESVEDIALRLERWYDVNVTIADEKLKKVKYTGAFEDESLQQVLEALNLVGIKSTINKKEVILRQ